MAIMSGPRHVFTLANPLYCHILGRTEEALLGKTDREAFPELAAAAPQRRLDDAYRTDMRYASPDTLVRLNAGDGDLSERWFQFSIEPMHDLAGRVQGLMSVATDVTAQVLARRALEQSHAENQRLLKRAQDAARAKDEFLAMLGHELRNPLAPIVSALHVMQARQDSTTEREQAVISRIARGRVRLQPSLTRAAVILRRAAEMAQPLIAQRRHELIVEPPARPVLWWGDADRLVQVVSNLLTNAARYTPVGGRIHLSGGRVAKQLVIEVTDNGMASRPRRWTASSTCSTRYSGRRPTAQLAGWCWALRWSKAWCACTKARSRRTATAPARAAASWCACRCASSRSRRRAARC